MTYIDRWRWLGIRAPGSEKPDRCDGRVGHAATVGPLGSAQIGNPLGSLLPPSGGASLRGFLSPAPLVKLAQEIIEIPFLRTLVALEGEKGSDFFNVRFHGD